MTVRHGEVHKLIRREISKHITLEVVTGHCSNCDKHAFILIHIDNETNEQHVRCLLCLKAMDKLLPATTISNPKKNMWQKLMHFLGLGQ